ncbi:MAG: argininosuccinate lyase [Verrucomicrobia bacterium A1]|nr:MAG: argininosuccinate lyase [Verrucomicrobia bacterium A1]
MARVKVKSTTVGAIREDVLAFTAGNDIELDRELVEFDCMGTAAHAVMLAGLRVRPPILRPSDARAAVRELGAILRQARVGRFRIRPEDQDCHLAIERTLTERLGETGRRIHTGRSRNDQVATALRLHTKANLLATIGETATLAHTLVDFAETHRLVPMAGRTHLQPAMPSSVGLWAAAWAEDLLDDAVLLIGAFELADQCPLGSAASYGVPLPIDREKTARLLGFSRPTHTVLYANHSRGKIESIALNACGQVMITLSRLAQDLILFSMPEFGYFTLPAEFCTGSSIMPQKRNPDVLELTRSRAARVLACAGVVQEILRAAPSGYNRDLQDTKAPYLEGIAATRAALRVLDPLIRATRVHPERLAAGFTPDVFATDRALELVAKGMPFRDAYHHVKERLDEVGAGDPVRAAARKKHLGAPGGLDFTLLRNRAAGARGLAAAELDEFHGAVSGLLNMTYPPRRGA